MYDIYCDYCNFCTNQKQRLIALCCIHIASKIEENDLSIPEISILLNFTNQFWKRDDLKEMEISILTFFDWYVLFPTAATYIDYFANNVVQLEEYLINDYPDMTLGEFFTSSNEIVLDFLDLILQDVQLVNINPSVMAAACLSATRKQIGIENVWSESLRELTGYNYTDIQEYVETLFNLKNKLNKKFEEIEFINFTPVSSTESNVTTIVVEDTISNLTTTIFVETIASLIED